MNVNKQILAASEGTNDRLDRIIALLERDAGVQEAIRDALGSAARALDSLQDSQRETTQAIETQGDKTRTAAESHVRTLVSETDRAATRLTDAVGAVETLVREGGVDAEVLQGILDATRATAMHTGGMADSPDVPRVETYEDAPPLGSSVREGDAYVRPGERRGGVHTAILVVPAGETASKPLQVHGLDAEGIIIFDADGAGNVPPVVYPQVSTLGGIFVTLDSVAFDSDYAQAYGAVQRGIRGWPYVRFRIEEPLDYDLGVSVTFYAHDDAAR